MCPTDALKLSLLTRYHSRTVTSIAHFFIGIVMIQYLQKSSLRMKLSKISSKNDESMSLGELKFKKDHGHAKLKHESNIRSSLLSKPFTGKKFEIIIINPKQLF
jgi:hypothetical protein